MISAPSGEHIFTMSISEGDCSPSSNPNVGVISYDVKNKIGTSFRPVFFGAVRGMKNQ
jgi:hypothetical protein